MKVDPDKEYKRAWRARNIEKVRAGWRESKRRTAGSEKERLTKRAYYLANRERLLAYGRAYQAAHPEISAARCARRYAAKKNRLPVWADRQDINNVYKRAEVLSKSGVRYHVDHEIPLQGKTVSGLHTASNLRVIPWYENLSKKNRFSGEVA